MASRRAIGVRRGLAVAPVLLCLVPGLALADAVGEGRIKARMCNACHGKNGIATNPEAPNLAGENIPYIEKQLKAFRSGERQHRMMSIIAKPLSDEDIHDLAAWYAAMKVTVELPPE